MSHVVAPAASLLIPQAPPIGLPARKQDDPAGGRRVHPVLDSPVALNS